MKNPYITYIEDKLRGNFDLHFRTLELDFGCVYIAFINSICDEKVISKYVIQPLLTTKRISNDIDVIKNEVIITSQVEDVKDEVEGLKQLLHGKVIIAFSFSDRAICCDVKNFSQRAVEIPPTEAVLKGPREGFTESLISNISLIRKHLKDANLKCESMIIGEKADTEIVFVYIQNMAPSALVNYIKEEVGKIKKGFITHGNYISEQLATKRTAFDTIAYTEKPEVFCAKISEGKVGIIVQGDPAAITAPCFFMEKFHTTTDYATVKYVGNFIRIIRWFAFTVGLLVPGFYVALTSHHFSLIPRMLAFRLSITRAGVPFPIFIEFFLLTIFFQILREAGIRLPQPIGQAVSIVGALILGDAAVSSGLASDITVLIVALTSISTFLIPAIAEAIVMWSSILVLFSTLLGLPGFFIGFAVLCSHMAGLRSCGYPYLYPLGTLKVFKFKDRLLRADLKEISNNIFEEDKENE